jgi:hypothetical protein
MMDRWMESMKWPLKLRSKIEENCYLIDVESEDNETTMKMKESLLQQLAEVDSSIQILNP